MQIFYEEASGQVTAWHPEETVRPLRSGEAKVYLDILHPKNRGASVRDYVCDGATLKLRPDFMAPPIPMDVPEEINTLKAKIEALEAKLEVRSV